MERRVLLSEYSSDWSIRYKEEVNRLRKVLAYEFFASYHIGSTAIPNLLAKPIIDILVEVHDIERIDEYSDILAELGYRARGENGIKGRRFFTKGEGNARSYHVHIFQIGHEDVTNHLNFRDFLIAHPAEAQEYNALKVRLAKKHPSDMRKYTSGKGKFIRRINRRAKSWIESIYGNSSANSR